MKDKDKIMTKTIIGTRAYPADNSYCFPVKKRQRPITLGSTVLQKAKKVTIVSEPYELDILSGTRKMREFVTVEYKGQLFVVLNRFKNHPNHH